MLEGWNGSSGVTWKACIQLKFIELSEISTMKRRGRRGSLHRRSIQKVGTLYAY